jgi:hypothetical protein|tara:strand:- start:3 stop:371 length:369 start_codon:yes stop_codon:yes gene_type:complete
MITWIKDKWELVVSGLVVLFVFVLGRKSKQKQVQVAQASANAKEKEIEVIVKTASDERLQKSLVRKKYSESRLALMQKKNKAQTDLEKRDIERKLKLIEQAKEDPDEIDRILMEEFNIAKLK